MDQLFVNYVQAAAVIIYGIGFFTLFFNPNMIKKIIGFDMMDSGIFLFLTAQGFLYGGHDPIVDPELAVAQNYINPLPTGLVLTGIVVGVSVSAFMLALTVRLYYRYHTLNLDEIIRLARKEED